MATDYDDEEEKRRLREQTATMRQPAPAPDFTGARGLGAAETARQGAMQRIGGYVANPNDTVAERSYGSDWARSMRARGRLSAPSLAEQSLGQARAAQRINAFRAQHGGGEDAAWRADAYGEVADRLQQQVDRDKQLEREEMEKWLESQSKNLALSVAERQKHAGELQRLHAEDAALRQDDLARFGIESRERIAGGTNQANIRVAELGLEGTKATALGGVEQARLRGQADVDAAGVTAAGNLRVEQQRGQNAIDAVNAAPMTAAPDGTIYDRTDRTGQNIFEKPQKPEQGTTLKPGEVYRDSSGKLTVAPGAEEADINRQIVALYEAAYQPGQSEAARADALARVNTLREELARRRQPAGQAAAGAGGPKNFL